MTRWMSLVTGCVLSATFFGCGAGEIRPVEIYPEDNCSYCRMAISDQSYAAEIITAGTEVYKFDDIGCMEHFTASSHNLSIVAKYVKNYETKSWLLHENSTIVGTGIETPMGSGKLAFADPETANRFVKTHPPR